MFSLCSSIVLYVTNHRRNDKGKQQNDVRVVDFVNVATLIMSQWQILQVRAVLNGIRQVRWEVMPKFITILTEHCFIVMQRLVPCCHLVWFVV